MKFLTYIGWVLLAIIAAIPVLTLVCFIASFTVIIIVLEEISLIFIVPIKFKKFYIPFKKEALRTYMSIIKEMLYPNKS